MLRINVLLLAAVAIATFYLTVTDTNAAPQMNYATTAMEMVNAGLTAMPEGSRPEVDPAAADDQIVIQNMTVTYIQEVINKNQQYANNTHINNTSSTENGPGSNMQGLQGMLYRPFVLTKQ